MYTMNTNIGQYKTELFCIVTMVDLIASHRIRYLNMPILPKILRTHLTFKLKEFTGLKKVDLLLLGFGKDSRLASTEELVAPSNIIDALRGYKELVHLILPKSVQIISSLPFQEPVRKPYVCLR